MFDWLTEGRIGAALTPRQRQWIIPLLLIFLFALISWLNRVPEPVSLPDFTGIESVAERKAAFFDFMIPLIREHNQRIGEDRQKLLQLQSRLREGRGLDRRQQRWLRNLAQAYRLGGTGDDLMGLVSALLLRVDSVPEALVVVQAAKESSWGRSRFSVEVNNLFGQWCFREGCGIVPARRLPGKIHEVEKFATVGAAVASYLRNLNSHSAYSELREIRAQARERGEEPEASALAGGLIYYSENREVYVEQVQSMIRQYEQFQRERAAG